MSSRGAETQSSDDERAAKRSKTTDDVVVVITPGSAHEEVPGTDTVIQLGDKRVHCVRDCIRKACPILNKILINSVGPWGEVFEKEVDWAFEEPEIMEFIIYCIHDEFERALGMQNCRTLPFLHTLAKKCDQLGCAHVVPKSLEAALDLQNVNDWRVDKYYAKELFIAYNLGWVESFIKLYRRVVFNLWITTGSTADNELKDKLSWRNTPVRTAQDILEVLLPAMYQSRIDILRDFWTAVIEHQDYIIKLIHKHFKTKGDCPHHPGSGCLDRKLGSLQGHFHRIKLNVATTDAETFTSSYQWDVQKLLTELIASEPESKSKFRDEKGKLVKTGKILCNMEHSFPVDELIKCLDNMDVPESVLKRVKYNVEKNLEWSAGKASLFNNGPLIDSTDRLIGSVASGWESGRQVRGVENEVPLVLRA